jgi:hypothetical protein
MLRRWRFAVVGLVLGCGACERPNYMTGGAQDSSYTAGFDEAIDRERRGLAPPPEVQLPTWDVYWCQIIRSIDSPPPSGQKKRLKRYLTEKRRAYGLAELNCP